jgi:uncharacterized Zn finger protein
MVMASPIHERQQYAAYFPSGVDVRPGDRITVDGKRYRVLSVSAVEGRALLKAVVEPWEERDGVL